jgi:hypothetical protein
VKDSHGVLDAVASVVDLVFWAIEIIANDDRMAVMSTIFFIIFKKVGQMY